VLRLAVVAWLGLGEPVAWSGDDACPGAAALLDAEVARQLGPSAGAAEPTLEVEARIEAGRGEALELALTLRSDAGHERHRLRAGSCAALLEQAAILIASARDPYVFMWRGPAEPRLGFDAASSEPSRPPVQRPSRRVVAESQPDPQPPVEPVLADADELPLVGATRPAPSDAQPRPRASEPVRGALGIGGGAVVGLFPNVGGGAALEGALERGAFRWQLAGAGWAGGRFRTSEGGLGGDLWALELRSGLCGVPLRERRVRMPVCALGGGGALVADAVGTAQARRSAQAWGWLGAEVRVQVLATPRLALGLGLAVQIHVVRPGWFVSSPDAEFRVPPVSGLLHLGLEFRGLGENPRNAAITSRGRGQ
jgi:hypothetical protein